MRGKERRCPDAPKDRRHRPFVIPASVVAVFILGFGLTTLGFYVIQHRAQVRFDAQQAQDRRQQRELHRQQAVLYQAQLGSCWRVNRLRANDNRNAVTEYETLQIIVELTKGPSPDRQAAIRVVLARLNRVAPETVRAIVDLMRPVPGLDGRFRRLAKKVKYIPATKCRSAVGTPRQFQAPAAIPIYKLSRRDQRELQRRGQLRRR